MRFDLILAQYLNQHKKLNLPGIGTFETDSSLSWDENGKQKQAGSGIVFRNVSVPKADDDLIEFITEHTGKMKPLAISDLESYLTLGKQFLYIGKPFYLEGIGTLQFAKTGNFEFTAGEYVTTKLEEPQLEKVDERGRTYDEDERKPALSQSGSGRTALIWLIILVCLGLAGWGGYYFYTRYAGKSSAAKESALNDSTAVTQDSQEPPALQNNSSVGPGSDTSSATRPTTARETFYDKSSFKKFIVESTTDKLRALNRYRKLKAFGNDIEMESTDSVHFSLYFVLPATNADTLRLKDSLNRWYYGNAKTNRVTVAQ